MAHPSPVPPVACRGLQHFNIAFGGQNGVGKSTIFRHLRKTPLPGRRDYKQISSQGGSISRDCCKFSFMTDSAEIRVTLWDTGGLERFRSMTRSYFHHLSALVLVHSTNKDSSLEHLGGWINQATDETSPPILCVWTNVVDASDTDEQRVAERVPHFISHYNIDARLCFNICAVSGKVESERQSAIVDACNTLLDRLIQNSLVGSASYSSGSVEPTTGSFSTTLVSEPVRNEAMSLQLDYDAVDGEKTQSPRHCWGKC